MPVAAAPTAFAVTAPAAAETWTTDSLHYVTWTAPAEIKAVTVEFSTDGAKTWAIVTNAASGQPAAAVPSRADGPNQLLWRVPATPGPVSLRVRRAEPAGSGEARIALRLAAAPADRAYRWEQVTLKAAFAGRDGAGAVVFKDRMWLLGGWNPGDKVHFPTICNSEVWSSADGKEWLLALLQAPWEGRHTAGYVVHQGRMWIVGGDANQRHYQNDVWHSADGVQWARVHDAVPWGPRVLHHTVAHGGRIWVMGGQTLPQFGGALKEERFYNDVWSSADGRQWERVLDRAPWSPRGMIGGAAVHQGRIWLLGGGTYDTPAQPKRQFFSEVWSTADGKDWTRHVEFAPWAPRQYHDVAVFDGRLWVTQGYDGRGNRKDVWHSTDGVIWYELPGTPWAPRHASSLFVHADALWVVAGNNMFPDVWRLAPTAPE